MGAKRAGGDRRRRQGRVLDEDKKYAGEEERTIRVIGSAGE
jgi:hypothetical protein